MIVACIGDSLGLPRDNVKYEDTWIFKLETLFPDYHFVHFFQRTLTTKEILGRMRLYSLYHPEVIILQVGICDCAPRYINEKKTGWKLTIRFFRALNIESHFWTIIKKFFRRRKKCVYVKKELFANNLRTFVSKAIDFWGTRKIVIIKIAEPTPSVLNSSPEIAENVRIYNSIIDSVIYTYRNNGVVSVNPLCFGNDDFYVDGYHTNSKGSDLVVDSLRSLL